MAAEGDERTAKFNDIVERRRLVEYRDNRLAFARFLAVNAVFMPAGFKERFMSVDAMINAALVEFEVRLNYPVKFGATWDSMLKLSEKGKQELDELEKLIHQRIWSAGNGRDKISVQPGIPRPGPGHDRVYHQAMIEDPEELAALQRLMLMFVPEAERAAFMAAYLELPSAQETSEVEHERRLD